MSNKPSEELEKEETAREQPDPKPEEQPPEESGGQDAAESAANDELERQQSQYNALNERYLRTLAEYDNFRKRSQREKEAVYPTAVAATVEKFLPVIDAFERAMACECADAEFKKGVDMIFDALKKTLETLEIEEIGAVGEPFDANIHNAVMHIEDDTLEKNVVAGVLQKGYRIGGRVLRYAMVSVAN